MEIRIEDELYARSIGWEVMQLIRKEEGHLRELRKEVDSDALRLLEQIKRILNDDTIEDPDCFERIEQIVQAFDAYGIRTSRHDWA